jgi:hypothetical protein
MAARDFRMVADEERLRKAALVGQPDATLDQRLAALKARMQARIAPLTGGAKVLSQALQGDDDRGRYIHIRQP